MLASALLIATACTEDERPIQRLELARFVQDGDSEVTLNEPLVFHFDRVIDRASVHSGSVRIVEANDPFERVRGELLVDRKTLTFQPDLPLDADLLDGSFRPGTTYRVELVGFPRPDGIRSVDGAPLAATVERTFRTATGDGAPLFTVGRGGAGVHLKDVRIGPLDPIELIVDGEAVDPRSLRSGEFVMRRWGDDSQSDLPMRPRLVENHATGARILLFPESDRPDGVPESGRSDLGGLRALEPDTYDLVRAGHELTDLGGQPLFLKAERDFNWRVPIEVRRNVESRRVTFESIADRYFGEPFGYDATAAWVQGEGGITIRYPRAAGDGRDGAFTTPDEIRSIEGRADVAATTLSIPQGTELDLSSVHGFVVLRSQGALEVNGALRRTLSSDLPSSMASELRADAYKPASEWRTLTEWLERSRRLNEPWTVLIAGGELRVKGEIAVDGPLMLIAGGWIRIYGRVDAPSRWKSHEGGDNGFNVSNAPLVLDPPETNELRAPLRVAILSNPIRPPDGVERWISAVPEIPKSAGLARVRYLGLRDRADGNGFSDEYSPVDDIELVERCQAVRLLFELEMPTGQGEPWAPPTIEAVMLTWRRLSEPALD